MVFQLSPTLPRKFDSIPDSRFFYDNPPPQEFAMFLFHVNRQPLQIPNRVTLNKLTFTWFFKIQHLITVILKANSVRHCEMTTQLNRND